jgi:Predicted 3'-5' exonuclease related to the exonuclease domain of PolB
MRGQGERTPSVRPDLAGSRCPFGFVALTIAQHRCSRLGSCARLAPVTLREATVGVPGSARRSALVFDIETIADLTPATRDAVAALAKGREMSAEEYGGLCPPLARVVCVAWLDVATGKLNGLFDATMPGAARGQCIEVEEGSGAAPSVVRCDLQGCEGEAAVLRAFGEHLVRHAAQPNARLVTYNGRGFDLPVLVHRAIKHGVTEGRDILVKAARDNRYNPLLHIDLMDVVTFGGAAPRWPMAAYAIGLGFKSPKHEMDGSQVWQAVQGGRILDVMRYCAGDVLATAHIYQRLHDTLGVATP